MSNWNFLHHHLYRMLKRVASLPMRNWNGIDFFVWMHREFFSCEPTYEELKLCWACKGAWAFKSCEPTYEELKRRYISDIFQIYFSCEPTYEELKLSVAIIFPSAPIGCEPTYEELKLCLLFLWFLFWLFCCEPTYEELKRNKIFPCFLRTFRLRAYLWGIETLFLCLLRLLFWFVASLPMRNWNY